MLVSSVQSIALRSAVFCIVFIFAMCDVDAIYDNIMRQCSYNGRVTASEQCLHCVPLDWITLDVCCQLV